MKYILAAIAGILIHMSIAEILDLNEAKRYTSCTLKTNNYDKCSDDSTWLYRNYPYRLDLFDCVFPGGEEREVCHFFGIKRSK